jgi:hypothetical protein
MTEELDIEEQQTEESDSRLTSNDRCDTCIAQAYVQVFFGESSLHFCAHHYTEYEANISKTATTIYDRRSDLLQ